LGLPLDFRAADILLPLSLLSLSLPLLLPLLLATPAEARAVKLARQ